MLFSQSYIDLINQAKSSEDELSIQLSELYEIIPLIDSTVHADTIGLVYYFIATRHNWNKQIADSKRALDHSIYYFNKAGYSGYKQAFNYIKRAEINKLLGFSSDAVQDAKSIFALPRKGRSLEVIGDANRLIANIYRDKGDDESAIRHLEYFLTTSLADSIDAYSKATILLDISLAYSNYSDTLSLNKSFEAISQSTNLIPLFVYPDEKYKQQLLNEMQTAFIYHRKTETENAINSYEHIVNKIDFDNSSLDYQRFGIIAKANLISLYSELDQDDKAHKIISEFNDLNLAAIPIELANANSLLLENMTDFQNKSEQLKAASVSLNKAFSIHNMDVNFMAKGLHPNINRHRISKLLHSQIKLDIHLYRKSGDKKYLHDSKNRMHTLDTIIDYINQDILFESSVLNWREEAKEFYNAGIQIAYALNDHESFWYYCEKAKGLALLDGISNDEYFLSQSDILTLIQDLKLLQLEEQSLNNRIDLDANDKLKLEFEKDLTHNKNLQKNLLQQRNDIIKKQIPQVADLESIQLRIRSGTIIQYYMSNEDVYALVLNRSDSQIYKLAKVIELRKLISSYRTLLHSDIGDSKNYTDLVSVLKDLHLFLISPLKKLKDHLIIIPDGDLFLLPFESMLTSEDDYLIEKYSIQYLLSATLNENTKNVHKVNHTVIASPIYEGQTFLNLTEASTEAKVIAEITNGKLISTDHKQEIIDAFTESDIFHFTGHSQMNENEMNDSYLAISDSIKLSESEIYNYPNTLKLVVLSACDTGLGKILRGEGVSNLTRSFIYTGAQSVVQSLWKINDSSSQHIMTSFYKELKAGKKKSKALQTAKINYLNTVDDFERHPYYWSGLVLVGSDASLDFQQSLCRPVFLLLVFLFGILLFLFVRKKNSP